MDIINKSYSLYLTCAFVFVLCCSMSHCKDITPGPLTTVHGTVKDYTTGNPVANVKLQVVQTTGGSFSSFPLNHLSVNNFSQGFSVFFQYKAVVLMLA